MTIERHATAKRDLLGHQTIRISGLVAAIIFLGVAAYQVALALGAPWAEHAWGGSQQAELTTGWRIATAVAAVSLVWMALTVLSVSGVKRWIKTVPDKYARKITWVITLVLTLNTLGNIASQSDVERFILAPTTALLATLTALIAYRGQNAGSG